MMPEGVEHNASHPKPLDHDKVTDSMMPEGVEHYSTRSKYAGHSV